MGKKEEKKSKNKKKKSPILRLFLLTIFVILAIFATRFYVQINENGGGFKGVIKTTLGLNKKENLGTIYTLVLGTNDDNTDTIMVAGYNPKTNEASILSIPRDTFIGSNIKNGGSKDKINSLYRIYGINKILDKVNVLTGMKIEKYVVVDTKGIQKIVDEIGGIEYDVPIDMNYHDESQKLAIELKKGMQRLNGVQAEGLVRFRHNDDGSTYPASYGIEDIGRNRTQQGFIKELVKQTLQFQNITKIFDLIKIVQDNIKTNITVDEMKDYATYILDFNPENIKTGRVPGEDKKTTAWFFEPYPKELKKTIFELFVFSDDIRKVEFNEKEKEKENTNTNIKEEKDKSKNNQSSGTTNKNNKTEEKPSQKPTQPSKPKTNTR